jgi:hypothetical protein
MARQLLVQNGYAVKVTDVVALDVQDRPGGLGDVLEVVERAGDKMGLRVPDDSAWGNHKWLKRR